MNRRTSRLSVVRLSAFALVPVIAMATHAFACPPTLDLTGWTLFDPDNDWALSNPTPTSVRLTEQDTSPEVHPGWGVSDFTLAATVTIQFDLSVTSSGGDDDFIGLGFSYLDGDHSYLLDWKRATQTFNWGDVVVINDDTAEQGLKIKRINGSYTWDGLWGGTDGLGVTTIAGPTGGAWVAGTVYHFIVELSPGHIVVTRDGLPLFNVADPSYPGGQGAIAIYGFSQNNLVLSEFCITPPPTVCLGDLDGDAQVTASDLAVLLGAWGTPAADLDGDGTTGAADLAVLLGAWGPCA